MKPTIRIYDHSFADCESSVPGKAPEHFTWVRDQDGSLPISVYTHDQAFVHAHDLVPSGHTRIAWLFESVDVCPQTFNLIFNILDKYDYIFTYYRPFVEFDSRFQFVPAMGTWIGGSKGGGACKMYPKTKLCSMIASNKEFTPLQRYRRHIVNIAREQGVDIYGGDNPIEHKIDALADYMFSIVIENGRHPGYQTEKLLDCFAVGTIPVYLGDPYPEQDWFTAGIISLEDILSGKVILSPELYKERIEAVQRNLDRLYDHKRMLSEDYMWDRYLRHIGNNK